MILVQINLVYRVLREGSIEMLPHSGALNFDFTLLSKSLSFKISLKIDTGFRVQYLADLPKEEVHDVVKQLGLRVKARFV